MDVYLAHCYSEDTEKIVLERRDIEHTQPERERPASRLSVNALRRRKKTRLTNLKPAQKYHSRCHTERSSKAGNLTPEQFLYLIVLNPVSRGPDPGDT